MIKRKILNREMSIVNDESEVEPFTYHSVPSIHISIEVKGISLEALVDSGSKGDFISKPIIEARKLSMVPIKPVHVEPAIEGSDRAMVDQKVCS